MATIVTRAGKGSRLTSAEGDANFTNINNELARVSGNGTTAARPSAATAGSGAMYFDTTLGKPVWSTGAAWVDATGAAV